MRPPNSWNRFREFLLKIERIWGLFENDALALEARCAEPAGGGIDHLRTVMGRQQREHRGCQHIAAVHGLILEARVRCTSLWGMRIEFVPEDELHRRPAHEVREPDGEAC